MPQYFTIVPDGPISFTNAEAADGNVYRLTLMNFGKVPLAFKFQTTAPHLFCCKPVVGFIWPNRQVTVGILLKAWKLSPTDHLPQQHSFKLMGYPTATVDNNAPRTFWTAGELLDASRLETRYFDVSISADFQRWVRSPPIHIGGRMRKEGDYCKVNWMNCSEHGRARNAGPRGADARSAAGRLAAATTDGRTPRRSTGDERVTNLLLAESRIVRDRRRDGPLDLGDERGRRYSALGLAQRPINVARDMRSLSAPRFPLLAVGTRLIGLLARTRFCPPPPRADPVRIVRSRLPFAASRTLTV